MPVFLDGREPPPVEAVHSWGSFSSAKWEGDMLRIETSHLKEDYIRRDGAMATDEANVTTWWIRRGCSPLSGDRKSTRLNSSHLGISYAVFCLKKKTKRD